MEKKYQLTLGALRVPVTVSEPDSMPIRRVVLGVHGFGGSSLDEIQTGMAEEMALFGSAMVRFDFPAHGANPQRELTLSGCMDTLLAAAGEAKRLYPEIEDLCIFATGFGAYVTLICLDELLELPGRIKLVIQTPSLRMHETVLSMMGITRETLWALDRYTVPRNPPFDVTYRFYEELYSHVAINSYPIPILMLHGEADAYIRMEDIHSFRRINDKARLVFIPGATHRFLEEGAWDMVLDLVRDWFMYEDVLLCDWE